MAPEAARQAGDALEHAAAELEGYRELALEAVRRCGHALRHAAAELKGDRELVMEAVRSAKQERLPVLVHGGESEPGRAMVEITDKFHLSYSAGLVVEDIPNGLGATSWLRPPGKCSCWPTSGVCPDLHGR